MVQNDSLESARAKLHRAHYHLERLKDEIESDGKAKKYGIAFRHESQTTNDLVINALMPRDLFIHYAIVAGEVVGHARSALEHAVWDMVPNPHPNRTGFPVFRFERHPKKRHYESDAPPMIEGINSKAAALIKAQQPFGSDYKTNPLYVLNELWKTDKHRALNFCAAYPQAIGLLWGDWRMIPVPANVKHGTELFRERHPGPQVNVGAEVAISGVVFDGGFVSRQPVPELLLKLVEFADRLTEDLALTI